MRRISKIKLIPIISIGGLLILFNFLIFPYVHILARAESAVIPDDETGTNVSGSYASLTIADAELDDNLSGPAATRTTTAYQAKAITVDAVKVENFELQISGNGNLTSTKVTNDLGAHDILTPIDTTTTPTDITENHWGYYYDQTGTLSTTALATSYQYQPITSTATTIDSKTLTYSDKFTAKQTKNLYFAAKFGQDVVDDEYTTEVELNLIITPRTVVGMEWSNGVDSGIEYMQEVDKAFDGFCNNSKVPQGSTITLKDKRDERPYTIKKIRKGTSTTTSTCWMIDNLALDINSVTINSSNTDTASGNSLAEIDSATYTRFTTTSGWSDTVTNANGLRRYAVLSPATTDRYLIQFGNYYSWCAATLGCKNASGQSESAFSTKNQDAISSICPKGWKLPRGGNATSPNDFADAFGGLMTQLSTSTEISNSNFVGWTNPSDDEPGYVTDLTNGVQWPASGYVYSSGFGGTLGRYWSRTANNNTTTFSLGFSSSAFHAVSFNNRYYGFSVRCLSSY